ncbi:RNA polymerase sigma factor [Spirosoma endbachense]|uniref:Sigma-70 family RNA polymerase sigma factor n=1 Tax=Spirosoma endbachense TaxID=2666025 RepID=A0A6P1VWY0_9BACT|nr:sigma-70 family RNA polymerase sigma factor [Spirosoma endbachense]QHV97613.1 sigma-70 family RNA polymerase sigma factor [Spirosoma endbachense]
MNDVPKSFWETIYKHNIAKMIGVCYRYTYNRQIAEDLAHDAFLVAIDKSSSFENKGSFEAWLRRIVVNTALQYLREQKKKKCHLGRIAYVMASTEPQNENQLNEETNFSEAELLEAIECLPEHHKLVFNLYVFDNFTHAQIGVELGISEGTSKSHLARARKSIRGILTKKAKGNKKRKKLAVLILLPDRLWHIDDLFTRKLNYFEIQPQKSAPIDTIDFSGISIPKFKSPTIFSENYLKTDVSTLAIVVNIAVVLFLHFNSYKEIKVSTSMDNSTVRSLGFSDIDSKKNHDKKVLNFDTTTATISDNGIISNEKTKHIEKMKTVNTLGALLLTGSTLAFDSTNLLNKPQQSTQLKNQEIVENNASETTISTGLIKSDNKVDSSEMSGTFYASTLFWSAVNNGLYLMGKHVKVNINSNKFSGSGTFSFITKINYLVINGTPMKLNETIQLSDKKYSLIKLSEAEAIKKYGDKGKLIVEITLAE